MLFRSNDTATTEIYTTTDTLSLHDALPISAAAWGRVSSLRAAPTTGRRSLHQTNGYMTTKHDLTGLGMTVKVTLLVTTELGTPSDRERTEYGSA